MSKDLRNQQDAAPAMYPLPPMPMSSLLLASSQHDCDLSDLGSVLRLALRYAEEVEEYIEGTKSNNSSC